MTSIEELAEDAVVHRIGGGDVTNLRLKEKESTLKPPGISVFLGGTAAEAAEQLRQAFPNATRLLAECKRVGTATIKAIREAGFNVVADPTRHFNNHARLIHPDGEAGFNDENLTRLAECFEEFEESEAG